MPPVVSLAEKAGAAIMAVYKKSDFGTTFKEDHSPLTQADLASHRLIIEGLGALTPDWPALSEESEAVPYAERKHWDRYWLIDPLDGTKEFIKRNDEFTVNIALIEQGKATLGVVHAPALGLSYFAAQGTGAFKTSDGRDPLRLSAGDYRKPPFTVALSRSHRKKDALQHLDKLGAHEVIEMGSSAKLCLVAEGAASLYLRLGRTMEWDTAASDCIVAEAGGSLTDLSGKALRYNKPTLSNPDFIVRGHPPFPLEILFGA